MKQVDYSTKTYDILNDDNEEMHDFHIQNLCNDEGDVIGWKYILGEDGERISLEDCISGINLYVLEEEEYLRLKGLDND